MLFNWSYFTQKVHPLLLKLVYNNIQYLLHKYLESVYELVSLTTEKPGYIVIKNLQASVYPFLSHNKAAISQCPQAGSAMESSKGVTVSLQEPDCMNFLTFTTTLNRSSP